MRKRGKKRNGKRGQLRISFGMLFSIILIIAFIAVAVYAIIMFLNIKKCADTGMFKQDLQEEINRAWTSDSSSEIFSGNLPSSLDYVCFVDVSEEGRGEHKEYYDKLKKYGYSPQINMFFWPLKNTCEGQRGFEIKHIDIKKITAEENPYCIKSIRGKVEVKIEKDFYDALVKISKIS